MFLQKLGTSGLDVTTIGLGSWAIGGFMWGGQDDRESVGAIHAALDHGVNWIDTAPIYGSGHSEVMVGRAIRELPVSRRPLIFTKFGLGDSSERMHRSATSAEVLAECDASLSRLGVDHVDLYQLHWPVPQPVEETADACATLLAAGKIRAIGVSNFSVVELEAWRATGVPLHSQQSPFSILRPAVTKDILPWCADQHVGVVAYSPLFRGLLFGTWGRDKSFADDDARRKHKDYQGARFQRHLDAVDELWALARQSGLSCAQLCIGTLLQTRGLTGCIVGARNARQGALVANLGVTITAEQAAAVWMVVDQLEKDLDGLN